MSWGNRAGKKTGMVWEAGGCQDLERLGRAGAEAPQGPGVRSPAQRLVAGGPSDSRQGRATAGRPQRLEAAALRASVRKKQLETAWRFWFPLWAARVTLTTAKGRPGRVLSCQAAVRTGPGAPSEPACCRFRDRQKSCYRTRSGQRSRPGDPPPALGAAAATHTPAPL